jgi:serine/threonine protein phosphatase PrpC
MALLNLFRRKPKATDTVPSSVATRVEPAPAPDPRPPFVVRSFGLSDRGQARPSNEDRFAVVELARTLYVHQTNLPQATPRFSSHRGHAFLVADGVGGHEGGEVASAVTVEAVEEFLLNTLKRFSNLQAGEAPNALEELKGAFLHAEARLVGEAAKRPERRGMGTTLTLAFAVNWTLLVAHAGDSRCYVLSEGGLRQVTRDHTLAAELVRQGVVSPGGEARHPYRHVVTNVLGGDEPGVRVELHRLDLHPDDVLLLCSDGLTEMIPDERIATTLREEPDPRRACERLVADANRHGGKDNITVIVAQVGGPASQAEAASAEAARLTPGP